MFVIGSGGGVVVSSLLPAKSLSVKSSLSLSCTGSLVSVVTACSPVSMRWVVCVDW